MSNIVSPFGDHCQELKRLMDKNSMVCVPFSGWHLSMFDVDEASGGLGSVIADYETYINLQSQFGPAFSVLALGGEVQTVGVFGAVQLWPGVAEAWAMPGTLAREKPVSFVRASRLILDADINGYRPMFGRTMFLLYNSQRYVTLYRRPRCPDSGQKGPIIH